MEGDHQTLEGRRPCVNDLNVGVTDHVTDPISTRGRHKQVTESMREAK